MKNLEIVISVPNGKLISSLIALMSLLLLVAQFLVPTAAQ